MKKFKNNNTLYDSVKMKFINDENLKKNLTQNNTDNKLYGPQGGWSSGRSQNVLKK